MAPVHPAGSRVDISATCARLRRVRTRKDLAEALCREITRYTLHDLQRLRGIVERDLRHVPAHYRQKLYPKTMEQIFGTHHTMVAFCRSGSAANLHGEADAKFLDFCSMVERASLAQETEERRELELLYYLLAGFAIFVLGRPAHAAGTPFPGGLQVEERDGVFFCPIRDREDDVETAICPFCPAKPSDHNRLPPPG